MNEGKIILGKSVSPEYKITLGKVRLDSLNDEQFAAEIANQNDLAELSRLSVEVNDEIMNATRNDIDKWTSRRDIINAKIQEVQKPIRDRLERDYLAGKNDNFDDR